MSKENYPERAVEYKENGYNCAQAVIKALSDINDMDVDELLKAAAGFAVGMGTTEATCGALIGANMMLGLWSDGQGTLANSKQLLESFKYTSGAVTCKELKGIGTGKVLCSCEDCVRNAVKAAMEFLD